MIQAQEFSQRRAHFIAQLPEKSIAIIAAGDEKIRKGDSQYPFAPQSNFYYLTGFIEATAVAVFIPGCAEGEYHLFNLPRNPEQEVWTGKRAGQAAAINLFGAQKAHSIETLPEFLKIFASENSQHSIYYSQGDVTLKNKLAEWQIDLVCENADKILGELRLVKSEAEIALMQRAADISSQAHRRVMQACKPGLFEYQLEAEFMHECGYQGARFQAYSPIVASGVNACVLHYEANDQCLQDGKLLLIDAGCENQHYASDITRTYPVNGKFTEEQRAIYQLVLNTQLSIIKLVKPGITFDTLQTSAIKLLTAGLVELGLLQGSVPQLISDKAYSHFYMHGVSHWLGLDTHDIGGYRCGNDFRKLQPGNVLTVEPGIYISEDNLAVDAKWRGIGVRIEDDVLVTDSGHRVLSSAPKTILELEQLVG